MERETQTIQMWTQGNYTIVGDWFASASKQLLDVLALPAGSSLLDVACGTGAVAIDAARRGAVAVGLDLTPAMLDEARRRAAAAGVQVTWKRGSFENLGHLGSFDAVTSAFGVMFANDPSHVAAQLAEVCAPGGQIAIASWHPDGAFGSAVPTLRALLRDLPDGPDITRWSQRESVDRFFAETPARLVHQQRFTLKIAFDSIDDIFQQLQAHSGPWQMLLGYLDARGDAAQAASLVKAHMEKHAEQRPDGRIDLRVLYAVSVLQRPPEP